MIDTIRDGAKAKDTSCKNDEEIMWNFNNWDNMSNVPIDHFNF